MDCGDQPTFNNKDEEIKYWKNLAKNLQEDVERIQRDADEYASESQQLEKEYEATIEQNEKKIKELTLANNRVFNEIESLRIKVDQLNKQNTSLQNEIDKLNNEKMEQSRYIRELEQKNDDLERSRRIIEESVAGVEAALNNVIERNAILESEIDEKESLKEKLQRLADETRDLKQELLVKEKIQDTIIVDNTTSSRGRESSCNGYTNNKTPVVPIDSNRLKEIETQTTPIKKDGINYQGSMSPASRVMALNIVSDLIRKVGGIERRLDRSRYEYREITSSDTRNRPKTSPTPPSIHGLTK